MVHVLIAVVASGCIFAGRVHAEPPAALHPEDYPKLSESEFRLLEEYLVAYKKLKAFYQNVRVTAATRAYRYASDAARREAPPQARPPLASVIDWNYVARGGREFRLESTSYERDNPQSVRRHGVMIASPQESFRLGRDLQTQKYFLRSHGKTFEDDLDWIVSYRFSVVPFSTGEGALLEDLVFWPKEGREIESVTETGPGEVTIRTLSQSERGWSRNSIQLLKSRCWAMKRTDGESYLTANNDRIVRFAACTYGGDVEGVPLVESLVTEVRGAVGEEDMQTRLRDEFQISVVPEPGRDSDFDVARLLPELDRSGQPNAGGRGTLLVLNGLVLLAVGIALAIWSRRSARTS